MRVLDASETSARGATLGRSEQLPFQVYSVTYDPDAKLVAVCGAVGLAGDVNLAVFRLSETQAPTPNVSRRSGQLPHTATRKGRRRTRVMEIRSRNRVRERTTA